MTILAVPLLLGWLAVANCWKGVDAAERWAAAACHLSPQDISMRTAARGTNSYRMAGEAATYETEQGVLLGRARDRFHLSSCDVGRHFWLAWAGDEVGSLVAKRRLHMLDHLLRLLKDRSAQLPVVAVDRRQSPAHSWAMARRETLEVQLRVAGTVADRAVKPDRSSGAPGGNRLPSNLAWSGTNPNGGHAGDRQEKRTDTRTGISTERAGLPNWPARFSAPYVDMAQHPMYDVAAVARRHGIKFFTLAFITADPQQRPAWGGFAEYGIGGEWHAKMKAQIDDVRAMGGDVMVSLGGGAGRELAEKITDLATLTAAYQQVIDAYKLTHVDFDIEGAAQTNRASIDRRSQAIAALQRDAAAAGRTLKVWFTLPVLPSGLTADGYRSLESAIQHGVEITGVNVMAMDFGESNAPNPAGKMGDYAIQAGTSLLSQLKKLFGNPKSEAELWKMVGITPMIGKNDVQSEIFGQPDARKLTAWASKQNIGRLSMWSLNRDKAHANGQIDRVEGKSSSIEQSPSEFSLIFEEFQK